MGNHSLGFFAAATCRIVAKSGEEFITVLFSDISNITVEKKDC